MSNAAKTTLRAVSRLFPSRPLAKPYSEIPIRSAAYALATVNDRYDDVKIPVVRSIGMKHLIALEPNEDPGRYGFVCSTDVRTQKVLEIAKNSQVSLSTWVPEEDLQIRMQANARTFSSIGWVGGEYSFIYDTEVDLQKLRREMWASDSFSGRTRAWHANPTPGSDLQDVGDQREGWTESMPVPSEKSMPKVSEVPFNVHRQSCSAE